MASPVEHITDLGLVNYVPHPTNGNYIVFRFADEKRAKDFENALKSNKIWFEKSSEPGKTRTFYLFGVHNRDYKKVQKINFEVEGQNRGFLVKNGFFRWLVVLFPIAVTVLAIVGYCKRPDVVTVDNTQNLINTSIEK